jgi:hypothetical protein
MCHHYLLDRRSGTADRLEHSQKRVRGSDLVVSRGPDQRQMPHLGVGDQVLEEVQRRWIQPLQIVEEQHERVLLPCEYAEKPPENHLKAILRVLRRQVRNRRLFSDHQLQGGNEVDDQLTVRAQRLAQGPPPPAKLRFALAQKRADKALEAWARVAYRMSRLYWSNLPDAKSPRGGDQHFVQFVHH